MHTALKEWAVVVEALARGEQIVLLRKGGIIEQTGEFEIERRRFLLFPSTFHPLPEYLRPEARPLQRQVEAERPEAGLVRIAAWAEAVDCLPVERIELARAMAAHTVYTEDYAAERFTMQKHRTLNLVVLRVHRLAEPPVIPLRRAYGGCTSWVDLAERFDLAGSTPALDDAAFARAVAGVRQTIGLVAAGQ